MKSYLTLLIIWAALLSALGQLPYDPLDIGLAGVYLTGICVAGNLLLAKLFRADASIDSPIITGLILTLIFGPLGFIENIALLSLIAVVAMASKYFIAWRKKHIFNPAAFAALAGFFVLDHGASWWVGNQWILPVTLIGGALITQKIERWHLVAAFLLPYLALSFLFGLFQGLPVADVFEQIKSLLVYSPLLFFAFVMLVEPFTSPVRFWPRVYFGLFTAVLLALFQNFSDASYTLELSLLAGNLFAWTLTSTARFKLALKESVHETGNIRSFIFKKPPGLRFEAGQYMDWSLPHFPADQRGTRRWFSLASSPTEDELMIAMRFSQPSSSFKQTIVGLKPNDTISAVGPQGDFILPKDKDIPLIWIAGGIGITPFRSQAKWLQDQKQKRKITLFYANQSIDQIAFRNLLDKIAPKIGMKIVYAADSVPPFEKWPHETGRIDMDMIKKHAPSYLESQFYISGPKPMVEAFETMLQGAGTKKRNIKVDYFPGYES